MLCLQGLFSVNEVRFFIYNITIALAGWSSAYFPFSQSASRGDEVLQTLSENLQRPTPLGIIGDSVIDSWNPRRDAHPDGLWKKLSKLLEQDVLNMAYPGLRPEDYPRMLELCLPQMPSLRVIWVELNPVLFQWEEALGIREFFHKQLDCWGRNPMNWSDLLIYAALKEFRFSGRPAWQTLTPGRVDGDDPDVIQHTAVKLQMADALDESKLEADLHAIHAFEESHGVKIFFFTTPVDLKTLRVAAGEDVYQALCHRIAVVRSVCEKNHWAYLDLSDLIPESYHFFDPHRVHLDEYARQKVAVALAQMYRDQMNEK